MTSQWLVLGAAIRLTRRSLREYAESKFAREGIEARPSSKITAVGPDWLELDGEGGKHRGEGTLTILLPELTGRTVRFASVVDWFVREPASAVDGERREG